MMRGLILTVCGFASTGAVLAQPAGSTNMDVRITVIESCTVSVEDLNFGIYTGEQLDGSTTVTTRCSKGLQPLLWLDSGSGSYFERRMINTTDASESLRYDLYRNAFRISPIVEEVWLLPTFRRDGEETRTLYGRIPANQTAAPGRYEDELRMIVEW